MAYLKLDENNYIHQSNIRYDTPNDNSESSQEAYIQTWNSYGYYKFYVIKFDFTGVNFLNYDLAFFNIYGNNAYGHDLVCCAKTLSSGFFSNGNNDTFNTFNDGSPLSGTISYQNLRDLGILTSYNDILTLTGGWYRFDISDILNNNPDDIQNGIVVMMYTYTDSQETNVATVYDTNLHKPFLELTSLPSQIQDLTISATGTNELTLNWTNTVQDPVVTATRLIRRTDRIPIGYDDTADGTYWDLANPGTVSTYVDSSVDLIQAYYYAIYRQNSGGWATETVYGDNAVLITYSPYSTSTSIDYKAPDTTEPDMQLSVVGSSTVPEGTTVTFDGSASSDAVGIITHKYYWTDINSTYREKTAAGQPSTESFLFNYPGVFNVYLEGEDEAGNVGVSQPVQITVEDVSDTTQYDTESDYSSATTIDYWSEDVTPPVIDIQIDTSQTVPEGTTITFDGRGTTDNTGAIDIETLKWSWTDINGTYREKTGSIVTFDFNYFNESPYTVTAEITDFFGNSSQETVQITVEDVPVYYYGSDSTPTSLDYRDPVPEVTGESIVDRTDVTIEMNYTKDPSHNAVVYISDQESIINSIVSNVLDGTAPITISGADIVNDGNFDTDYSSAPLIALGLIEGEDYYIKIFQFTTANKYYSEGVKIVTSTVEIPDDITNFQVVNKTPDSLEFSWDNSISSLGWGGTIIYRTTILNDIENFKPLTGSIPGDDTSGGLLEVVNNSPFLDNNIVDDNLTENTIYYYKLFTFSVDNYYSTGVLQTIDTPITPEDVTAFNLVNGDWDELRLTYINPTNDDYYKTAVYLSDNLSTLTSAIASISQGDEPSSIESEDVELIINDDINREVEYYRILNLLEVTDYHVAILTYDEYKNYSSGLIETATTLYPFVADVTDLSITASVNHANISYTNPDVIKWLGSVVYRSTRRDAFLIFNPSYGELPNYNLPSYIDIINIDNYDVDYSVGNNPLRDNDIESGIKYYYKVFTFSDVYSYSNGIQYTLSTSRINQLVFQDWQGAYEKPEVISRIIWKYSGLTEKMVREAVSDWQREGVIDVEL